MEPFSVSTDRPETLALSTFLDLAWTKAEMCRLPELPVNSVDMSQVKTRFLALSVLLLQVSAACPQYPGETHRIAPPDEWGLNNKRALPLRAGFIGTAAPAENMSEITRSQKE